MFLIIGKCIHSLWHLLSVFIFRSTWVLSCTQFHVKKANFKLWYEYIRSFRSSSAPKFLKLSLSVTWACNQPTNHQSDFLHILLSFHFTIGCPSVRPNVLVSPSSLLQPLSCRGLAHFYISLVFISRTHCIVCDIFLMFF